MPLLPVDQAPALHLAAEVQEERPRPAVPRASTSPPPSLPRAVAATTRRHWPVAVLHGAVLVAALLWGADSLAQPVDAAGAIPVDAGALSGSPWATVVAVALLALGQLGSGLREWARVRGTDLDARAARIAQLEAQLLDARSDVALARAERDLAQAREGDARAAASGTTPRPAPPPGE